MKKGIDWVLQDKNKVYDLDLLLCTALIPEEEYNVEQHGVITSRVIDYRDFCESHPEQLEPNLAVMQAGAGGFYPGQSYHDFWKRKIKAASQLIG